MADNESPYSAENAKEFYIVALETQYLMEGTALLFLVSHVNFAGN